MSQQENDAKTDREREILKAIKEELANLTDRDKLYDLFHKLATERFGVEPVLQEPFFTEEDEQILDRVWDKIHEKRKKKSQDT